DEAVYYNLSKEATLRAGQWDDEVARKAERDANRAARLVLQLLPVEPRQVLRGMRRAGEAARDARRGIAGERHFAAFGVEHHAARSLDEREAGGDVVLGQRGDRERGGGVARRDARQAVGRARPRGVA